MPYKDSKSAAARVSQAERNSRFRSKHAEELRQRRLQRYQDRKTFYQDKSRQYYWDNRDTALEKAKDRNQSRASGLHPDILKFLRSQGCCICGGLSGTNKKYRLSVDHDHDTGEFRGILCSGCNTGLGLFKSSPELLRKAADYIEQNRSPIPGAV